MTIEMESLLRVEVNEIAHSQAGQYILPFVMFSLLTINAISITLYFYFVVHFVNVLPFTFLHVTVV